MSIINAFIGPDVAVVGVDTDAIGDDGKHFECSKLYALNHVNAVVGFRGYMTTIAFSMPSLVSFSGSFDHLADKMPEIIKAAQKTSELSYAVANQAPPGDIDGTQVVLVGYSQKHGRMIGHFYEILPGSRQLSHQVSTTNILAPGLAEIPEIEADRKGMETLAKAQYDWIRQTQPGKSAGGRFFIAEVTKGRIDIQEAFAF